MAIEVRIPTVLRKHTGDEKKVFGAGASVRELFDDIDRRYPGLRDAVIGEDGQLHRFINVYVNDEDVRFLGGVEAALAPGDQVSILPAVAGGSPIVGT